MGEKTPLLAPLPRKDTKELTRWSENEGDPSSTSRVIHDYPEGSVPTEGLLAVSKPPRAVSNMFWTSFNLMNDVISSNIVSQSFYIYSIGFIASPFLYILFGLITGYTLNALFYLGRKYDVETYPQLALKALGKPGFICACFFIFLFNWGGLVAGLIQIGSGVPALLRGVLHLPASTYLSREWVLMWTCLIFLPLSFFRSIADYAFISFLSIASLFGLMLAIVLKAVVVRPHPLPFNLTNYPIFGKSILSASGGLSFMFVCHDLSFSVFSSFKDPTRPRWAAVVSGVISVSVLMWWAAGYAGLFVLQGQPGGPPSDVLNAFSDADALANAGRALQCFSIAVSLPYSIFMPRLALQSILKLALGPRLHEMAFHIVCTTVLMVSSVLVALFVDDLGFVYELIGAISASGLAYVLPPLMYLRLEHGPWHAPRKIVCLCVLACGLLIMVGGSGQTLYERFRTVK